MDEIKALGSSLGEPVLFCFYFGFAAEKRFGQMLACFRMEKCWNIRLKCKHSIILELCLGFKKMFNWYFDQQFRFRKDASTFY